MSQVCRALVRGPVAIDVRLLDAIEAAVMIDDAPGPGEIAPVMARADAEWEARRDPADNAQLAADALKVMDGSWLRIEEAHAVQRLRGWHRAHYGRITVDAFWLAETRNVLDGLTLSLGSECDQVREDMADYDAGTRAAIEASFKKYGTCGECTWCRCLILRDECDQVLDDAGFDGGSRYNAYCTTQESEADR